VRVCKSAIALCLNVIKRDCNQSANKSNHPNYNPQLFLRVYHPTGNNMYTRTSGATRTLPNILDTANNAPSIST
jgi:hypothetical protein